MRRISWWPLWVVFGLVAAGAIGWSLPVPARTAKEEAAILPAIPAAPPRPEFRLPDDLKVRSLTIGPDELGRSATITANSIRLLDSHGNSQVEIDLDDRGGSEMRFWKPDKPRRFGPEIVLRSPQGNYSSIAVTGAKMVNGFFLDGEGWRSMDMPVTAPRKMTVGDIPRD